MENSISSNPFFFNPFLMCAQSVQRNIIVIRVFPLIFHVGFIFVQLNTAWWLDQFSLLTKGRLDTLYLFISQYVCLSVGVYVLIQKSSVTSLT